MRAWYEALPVTAVQDAILRLYGPGGTGQIDPARIHSVSFNDLKAYLAELLEGSQAITPTVPTAVAGRHADAPPPPEPRRGRMSPPCSKAPGGLSLPCATADRDTNSDAVRVFLDNGDGRLGDTRLVVLAFNAPYYLDTTEINKLTLYLAAYSKTATFDRGGRARAVR